MDIGRASFKLFVSKVIVAATGFIAIIYFSRTLGTEKLGIFFLFQSVAGILGIFADFGLTTALEKRVSEGDSKGAFLASAITLMCVPLAVISCGVVWFRGILNGYFGEELARYLIAMIVLKQGGLITLSVLKGNLRVGEIAILRVARKTTWVVVGTLLVLRGHGVVGLVWAFLLGYAVMLVWGWYKVSLTVSMPTVEQARSLVDYAKYNFITFMGAYVYKWMDVAILGLFVTQASVGAYEVAWRVVTAVMLLSKAIGEVAFPKISQWDAQEESSRIEAALRDTMTPSLALVIPSFFGILILSEDILKIVFGPEFTMAWLVMIILMAEKLFQSVHVIVGKALQGIDHPDLAAYSAVASTATNLILNLLLIPRLGIVGAALATSISFVLNFVLHAYFLAKFIDINVPYREIGWLTLSSGGMVAVLLGVMPAVPANNAVRLFGLIGIGAAVYGVLALTYRPIRRKAIQHVHSLDVL